jgi:protease I
MNLDHVQIAVLAESQYQELELWYPVLRLRETGANVLVVGPASGQTYASKLGYPVRADIAAADIRAEDVDAVIIPGGFAPEGMRRSPAMVNLVREVHAQGGLVAAICHAGWMLASAGIVRGRDVTCVSIIKDDVIAAGGKYVDQPVVRDGNIITSRLPSDLPDFCREIVSYLQATPSRRAANAATLPRGGKASTANFIKPAKLVMTARGKASANYTTTVVGGEFAA